MSCHADWQSDKRQWKQNLLGGCNNSSEFTIQGRHKKTTTICIVVKIENDGDILQVQMFGLLFWVHFHESWRIQCTHL